MGDKEVIQNIRTALGELQTSGQNSVNIPALLIYLDKLERPVPTSDQIAEFQHQSNVEMYKAGQQANLEMFRAVITTGQTALKTALLINGGATIAVLTFLGNLRTHPRGVGSTFPLEQSLAIALMWFGSGVLLAAIATGATYLNQSIYAHGLMKIGNGFRIAVVILVIGTYCAFGWGLLIAKEAFLR